MNNLTRQMILGFLGLLVYSCLVETVMVSLLGASGTRV